jgi:hypothetical protein
MDTPAYLTYMEGYAMQIYKMLLSRANASLLTIVSAPDVPVIFFG